MYVCVRARACVCVFVCVCYKVRLTLLIAISVYNDDNLGLQLLLVCCVAWGSAWPPVWRASG